MVAKAVVLGLLWVLAIGCGGATDRGGHDADHDAGLADSAVERPDDVTITDVGADANADAAGDLTDDAPPGRCVSRKPPRALISDFSARDNSAFGVPPGDNVVGYAGAGGQIQNLQLIFDNADWRTTGTVAYGGEAELTLDWTCSDVQDLCPLDASDYAGIQFTIHRNAGSVQSADIVVGRNDNDTSEHGINCGNCLEPTDPGSPPGCLPPRATIAITQVPTVVTLHWSDFSGGLPHPSADPTQMTGIFAFLYPAPPPDGGAGGTYEIDVTIDDVQFIPF